MPDNTTEKKGINIRSEEVQEILTKPPSWIIRWGITLIFIFICIILFLAFLIRYPDFVSAKVLVTTSKPMERVLARYSGPIDHIFIENGDSVKKGETLAVLKNPAKVKDVYTLNKKLESLDLNSDDIIFPIDSIAPLILGDIEPTYISFEKNYIDYRILQELNPYTGQLQNNKKSLTEIKKRLKNQIDQKELMEKEFNLKKIDFNRNQNLFDRGVISQQEFENKKMDFLQIQRNLNNIDISISQMRESISTANQSITSTNINRRKDKTQFFKNLTQSFNQLKNAINDWEHKYVLKSSINGTASFHAFWGVNQFVKSGEIVFSILPENTTDLVGKLLISSQNAGKVIVGQKVLIKLDNFPYQQYGLLIGRVKNISISPDNEGNYFVYISLPQGTTTSYDKELPFHQELIGNAEIITEDLSVAERLFYKFRSLFTYN